MFCEKCGNKLNDNDKFCVQCGNPVGAPEQPKAPVQPQASEQKQPEPVHYQANVQTQAPAKPQAPVQKQPEPVHYQSTAQPQAPAQPQAHVQTQAPMQMPSAPKKGLSKGAKRGIIFGSIGVGAVAIIAALVIFVILPMLKPTYDLSKYTFVSLDTGIDDMVIDGDIDGEIYLSVSDFEEQNPELFEKDYLADSIIENIFYDIKVSYSFSGDGEVDYGYRYVYFYDASKDDVITVTIEWPDDDYSLAEIMNYEDRLGVKFDKSPKTIEFKIADLIAEQGLNIKEATELNILDYIKENNAIITKPSTYDDSLSVCLKPFETEIAGFKIEKDGYYGTSVSVYDGDDYIAEIYMDFDKSYDDVEVGEVITLSYSEYNYEAKTNALALTGDPIEYIVVQPEVLSLASSKNHANAIKEFFLANAADCEDYIEDGDEIEVNEIYFVTDKDDPDYKKIIVIFNNKTQNYYNCVELSSSGYFLDDEFLFDGYAYYNSKSDTLKEAKDGCSYIDAKSKYYTATKIG